MIQGSVVNAAAIVAGTAVGLLLRKGIQERYQQTVLAGVAMSVGLIGVTMALKTQNILLVIVSMVLGGLVGEFLDIDARLEKMGAWLTQRLGAQYGNVGQGFVTASLVFCIGAMAVVGSIQDGMTDDAATLYAKATLDGIASAVFASSMGAGVALSAEPAHSPIFHSLTQELDFPHSLKVLSKLQNRLRLNPHFLQVRPREHK